MVVLDSNHIGFCHLEKVHGSTRWGSLGSTYLTQEGNQINTDVRVIVANTLKKRKTHWEILSSYFSPSLMLVAPLLLFLARISANTSVCACRVGACTILHAFRRTSLAIDGAGCVVESDQRLVSSTLTIAATLPLVLIYSRYNAAEFAIVTLGLDSD
jgi:hypothetical protein